MSLGHAFWLYNHDTRAMFAGSLPIEMHEPEMVNKGKIRWKQKAQWFCVCFFFVFLFFFPPK